MVQVVLFKQQSSPKGEPSSTYTFRRATKFGELFCASIKLLYTQHKMDNSNIVLS